MEIKRFKRAFCKLTKVTFWKKETEQLVTRKQKVTGKVDGKVTPQS